MATQDRPGPVVTILDPARPALVARPQQPVVPRRRPRPDAWLAAASLLLALVGTAAAVARHRDDAAVRAALRDPAVALVVPSSAVHRSGDALQVDLDLRNSGPYAVSVASFSIQGLGVAASRGLPLDVPRHGTVPVRLTVSLRECLGLGQADPSEGVFDALTVRLGLLGVDGPARVEVQVSQLTRLGRELVRDFCRFAP